MSSHDSFRYQDFTNCTVLKESKYKKLLRGPVATSPDKVYLIKIYLYPGLWQAVKYFFRKSKAHRELALAQRISAKGIPTIVPEKVEDIRKRGLLQKSVVLTEYLPDCMNLEDLLLKQKMHDQRLRREIIREYGNLARLIHDRGIYQEDFDPNNILYQKKQKTGFQLYLIDFERTRIVKKMTFEQKIHSLAKLNRMGRNLSATDQLRFLTAYLGPQATRTEKRKLTRSINKEEYLVFLRDRRRALRKCTSTGKKIGFIKYNGYQGYYRKRHHSRNHYTESDIICLINSLAEKIPADTSRQTFSNQSLAITAQLDNRSETFQVRCFEYGGLKYRLPGAIKRTPLMAAWGNDNSCLKNRSAGFFPVAALEKKTAGQRYHGYLIRKN